MDNYKKGEKYFHKGKHKKAFKYYLLAVNEGNNAAVFDVGTMYWKGWGIEKDYHKAIEYFKKISDTGSAHAAFVIGEILASIDVSEAITYYEKAVQLGNEAAKERLYEIFEKQLEERFILEIKTKLEILKSVDRLENNDKH